jgi:hypothetical protein
MWSNKGQEQASLRRRRRRVKKNVNYRIALIISEGRIMSAKEELVIISKAYDLILWSRQHTGPPQSSVCAGRADRTEFV